MLDVIIVNAPVIVYMKNIQTGEDHRANLVENAAVKYVNTQDGSR